MSSDEDSGSDWNEESSDSDNSVSQKTPDSTILSATTTRNAIAYLFINKYKGLRDTKEGTVQTWNGKGGIIPKLRKDLGMKRNCGYDFNSVLMEILDCARSGKKFRPEIMETRGGKRPPTFKLDSIEAQIIADACESGLSTERALSFLNQHLYEQGKPLANKSSVISLMIRLNPKLKRVSKRKQGSSDPDAPWSKARMLTVTQLLVRLGELEVSPEPNTTTIPNKFDRSKLGAIELDQIVWWDETHRKCLIGGFSSARDFCLVFKRDENGKLDSQNGTYSNEEIKKLNCKYEDEGRFGLGCALVTPVDENGNELEQQGRRCELFDYSGKLLVSPDDWQLKMEQEFRRVKSLSSSRNHYWIENTAPKGTIFCDSPVKTLPKIGKKTADKLLQQGIKCVGDLRDKTDDFIKRLDGITPKIFDSIITKVRTASTETNKTVDHRKADNPYLSKFGEENWMNALKNSSKMSNLVLISDYVEHIWQQSAKVMKGTKHEHDWVVVHDALKIMTASTNKEWMRQKGFLHRWVLPSDDLYDHDAELKKAYNGNPIGNSPELMPWDCHLNQDVHASHDHHVLVTKHLKEEDPLKFSGSTPNRMAKSYKRLLSPDDSGVVPSSQRIMNDIKQIIPSLKSIYEAKGVIVEGLGNRKGRRFESNQNKSGKNHGGKRRKRSKEQLTAEYTQVPLHIDAQRVTASELRKKREEWSVNSIPEVCCTSPTAASELTGSPTVRNEFRESNL